MKILAIQNRKGIGDMVIFLPFIEAISKKFDTPVSILVKENSKAENILSNNKNISDIIILDRDNSKSGRHDGISGSVRLISDLKKYNFDKVFIFNSSLRFKLISKLAGIKNIYQYPLFEKKQQHVIQAAQIFLKNKLDIIVESNPKINISDQDFNNSVKKFNIKKDETNILLGIGGSGPTKRIPSNIFLQFMKLVTEKKTNCRFFLATGKDKEEQKILDEIVKSKFSRLCTALDDLNLNEILPVIKNCNISVCNDSSFSHLSAALNIPTIVLMADTPLLYGSYSPQMFPIIPDGEETVTHDTLGKNKINPTKIFEKFKKILN